YTSTSQSLSCIFPVATGAFLWEKGNMVDLGNLGGTCTFVQALNNQGQVVGGSHLRGDQAQHPFLWEQGAMLDLGTFGGSQGTSTAINESAVVVGFATYPGDQIFRAFLWKNGKKKDLGTLAGDTDSFVSDINA